MSEEKVIQLFEGTCPVCDADLSIVEVSGTVEFLLEQQFLGEHKTDVWDGGLLRDNDGAVMFQCANGHKHEAYHYPSGEWVAA